MYRQVAVKDRFISSDDIPQIDRLPYEIDDRVKRDIPTDSEYEMYYKYLINNYTTKKHNPDVDARELEKRKIFKEFVLMIANTGLRPKELLGVRKSEISELVGKTETDENLVITIRRENAKTGRQRQVISPVRKRLDRIYNAYRKIGIVHQPTDYIFLNPNKGKYFKESFGRMIMNNRLKDTLVASGLQEQLDKQDRSLSLYSFRHYYCYLRLIHKVPIHLLAENMGTSVNHIERTYGHINTQLHADVLTSGMGVLTRTETNITTLTAPET
jgi:integrase